MKKLFSLFLLTGLGVAFFGCEKNDTNTGKPATLSMSSESPFVTIASSGGSGTVEFPSSGGDAIVRILTDQSKFSIQNTGENWLSVTKNAGNVIDLSAEANGTGETLSATVTISVTGTDGNDVKASLTVTQAPAGTVDLTLVPKEPTIPSSGTAVNVTVTTNAADWTYEFTGAEPSWLHHEKQNATTLTLSADKNEDDAPRTASIKVTATMSNGDSAWDVITVTQEAFSVDPYLTLTPDALSFGRKGGEKSVRVSSAKEWTMDTPSESWVTAIRDGEDIVVTLPEYSGENNRSATIAVTAGSGADAITKDIGITQLSANVNALILELVIPDDGNMKAALPTVPLSQTDINCTVDWGDGNIANYSATRTVQHQYEAPGTYEVSITGQVYRLSVQEAGMSLNQMNYITKVIQWGNTGLEYMHMAFHNCKNLKYIDGDADGSFKKATSFREAFSYTGIEDIPANLFRHAVNVVDFYGAFSFTPAKKIPAGLFDYTPNVISFEETFYGSAVTSIPAKLFDKTTKATTFIETFRDTPLQTIPAGLFDKATEVTSFESAFQATSITAVPSGLFANCRKVTSFERIFQNTKLESIPGNLFAFNDKATTFEWTFGGCTQLAAIPDRLFDNCLAAKNFRYTFHKAAITEIPAGLFDNCTAAVDFSATFQDCKNLVTIPQRLFINNTAVTLFQTIFAGCSSLVTVPEQLFNASNALITAVELFRDCSKLETIPADLFSTFTAVTSFSYVFWNCSSLKSIPVQLFDNCRKVTSFNTSFSGCTALTGESPYTMLPGNVKVHLYERENHTSEFAAPTSYLNCFRNCTGLTDYSTLNAAGW